MIEVMAAVAAAKTAFSAIERGVQVAKDIHSMSGQLSQWASAMADIEQADKMVNRKPPWYKALGGGTQAAAMEIFLAKKQAEQMRDQLRELISHPAVLGPSHWTEFLKIEAELKQQKREEVFRRQEVIQSIKEWVAGIFAFVFCTGLLVLFVWLAVTFNG